VPKPTKLKAEVTLPVTIIYDRKWCGVKCPQQSEDVAGECRLFGKLKFDEEESYHCYQLSPKCSDEYCECGCTWKQPNTCDLRPAACRRMTKAAEDAQRTGRK
jgi:hypothetical protein